MSVLDAKTIERIAEVIVDIGSPYERKGYQLAELLKNAGWANPPEYDGSPRVPWLVEQLTERADNRAEIERLLCRVCDPIEYDEGMAIAEEFRHVINEKLAPEGLAVVYISGRPVIGRLDADADEATFSEPADFRRRLERLLSDPVSIDMLMNRLEETRICEANGAYTMAVIGIGSIVEGLLLELLVERDEEFRTKGVPDSTGKRWISPDRIPLARLIDIAHQRDWIQLDATKFMHTVRDFRNFIHPRKELAERPRFDRDSVRLCWAPVQALLNDLEENVPLPS